MYKNPLTAVVGEMPVTDRTSEGGRTLNESSHTPTRNKSIWYKALNQNLYIDALPPNYYNCHICLVEEKKHHAPKLPSSMSVSLSTYWAGRHLCWFMTKEHRLTDPLLPGVWWRLRDLPQDRQEDRLRLDLLRQVPTMDGDIAVDFWY